MRTEIKKNNRFDSNKIRNDNLRTIFLPIYHICLPERLLEYGS